MKKLSITFGNGVYFECRDGNRIMVGPFALAWWSLDIEEINKAIDKIRETLPEAQLSIVSHEPQPYTP